MVLNYAACFYLKVTNNPPQMAQSQLDSAQVLDQVFDPMSDQIINRILVSGKITATDRAWLLKAAFSDLSLTPQQLMQVRQVGDRLRMGLVKVVD